MHEGPEPWKEIELLSPRQPRKRGCVKVQGAGTTEGREAEVMAAR